MQRERERERKKRIKIFTSDVCRCKTKYDKLLYEKEKKEKARGMKTNFISQEDFLSTD